MNKDTIIALIDKLEQEAGQLRNGTAELQNKLAQNAGALAYGQKIISDLRDQLAKLTAQQQ